MHAFNNSTKLNEALVKKSQKRQTAEIMRPNEERKDKWKR